MDSGRAAGSSQRRGTWHVPDAANETLGKSTYREKVRWKR